MRKILPGLMLISLIIIAGCSQPPLDEEKRASDALDLARQAEADIYAIDAFGVAQDTLDAAIAERERQDEKFKLFRSYGDARQQFLRAETLANRSAELAVGEKNRREDDARDLWELATAKVDSCAALLDLAPAGKGTRTDLKMLRNDIATLGERLGEAATDLENAQWETGRAKAEEVISIADSLNVQITRAIEKKK